ncbi:coiled-coil domain-containing protein 191 [Papilio machaon]|uniref:coiled-coil domain-containing protein 191 n=1 Tax=Papilio machaon TaxID=76193 RepID=UPI001E66454D|nr:coiled-coil domain-containing protein 191 [Papilio machaon]
MKQRKDNTDINDINKKRKITQDNTLEHNYLPNDIKCVNNDLDFNYNIKTQSVDDNKIPASKINEHRTDLESLLIMMAIDSNVDYKERDDSFQKNILDVETNDHNNQISSTIGKENGKISEVLCIIPFRTEAQNRHNFLGKKYFQKWKIFTDTRRQTKEREIAINKFFDKLTEKKNSTKQSTESVNKTKLHVRDYNTYQHRYKVQKNIIALQKMKLNEQNKVIEQLKYNKIIESSKQSLETMRDEICKTYYQIDRQLKPKIKCLTNELKIREIEEPALVLHCLKVPQFIQRMEKRAREREEKHAMIRERRRQMEEERIRLKQQTELAKAEMDKEEKLKRMKELKEKRKKEKIENIRKKQHAERMRALIVMADIHYEKNLMAKYGINPLRKLMAIKLDNMVKAKSHYFFQVKKNVFLHWMWYTEDMWLERNYIAEDFYRKKILRKTFNSFKQNHRDYKLKLQVAEDYYDLYVSQLVFREFRKGIELIKKEYEMKWYKAEIYHNSNLLFKTFTCWRALPALNALIREQEARKLRWREKVLQVVPDYKPPEE